MYKGTAWTQRPASATRAPSPGDGRALVKVGIACSTVRLFAPCLFFRIFFSQQQPSPNNKIHLQTKHVPVPDVHPCRLARRGRRRAGRGQHQRRCCCCRRHQCICRGSRRVDLCWYGFGCQFFFFGCGPPAQRVHLLCESTQVACLGGWRGEWLLGLSWQAIVAVGAVATVGIIDGRRLWPSQYLCWQLW